MVEGEASGQLANRDLLEMWRKRPNRDYLSDQERVWVNVGDEEDNTKGGTENDGNETFEKLTPHKAFGIIKKLINPIYNTCRRNKNGSYTAQIPRDELELAVGKTVVGKVTVVVRKDKFRNIVRGTVFAFDTKIMPEEDILEELK